MAERLELLRLVEYERFVHCPGALLHIETALSSRKLGCSSAIEDCNGLAVPRSDEARRRAGARLAREGSRSRVRLRPAGEEEEDLPRAPQRREAERHSVDERLEPGLGRESRLSLPQRRRVGEERG